MDLTRDFIEKIEEMTAPTIKEIDDTITLTRTYIISHSQRQPRFILRH